MRQIKFRVRTKRGKLIGYERFIRSHWQCITTENLERYGEDRWTAGTLAGDVREQYIDQKDGDGVEIYEGDICLIGDGGECFGQDYNENDEAFDTDKFEIYWSSDGACFYIKAAQGKTPDLEFSPFGYANFKVVGNKWDNPELVQEEATDATI